LGLPFETWSPQIDEHALDGEAPKTTAIRLARLKAEAAAGRGDDGGRDSPFAALAGLKRKK